MSTITNSGTGVAGSGVNFTIPFTPISGRSLVVIANNETSVNDITGLTDSGGNTWVEEFSDAYSGGNGRRVFRCKTVGTAPTWVKTSGSSGTIHYGVVEATGMDSGSIESCAAYADTGTALSHIATFGAATNNAMAIVHVISGTDLGTITPTNGFTEIPTIRNGRAAFFKEDLGALGSKTLTYTSSLGPSGISYIIAVYKSAVSDPTVSTVTGTTVTEGGNSVFTVTLSGATSRTTNYAVTLAPSGTYPATGGGVDFTNDLSTATFGSSGVTYSAGNLIVPSGILIFPVVISTSSDLLDEYDETYTLTVGGISSIATILDNNPVQSFITSNVASSVNAGYPLVFNYTVRPISGKDITAELTLTPDTAIAGTHYTTPVTSGMFNNGVTISGSTVTIPAGTSSFTLTIPTIL